MLRELSVPVLFGFACAALLSTGAGASELPPLSCRTVRAPGATCVWVPGATCTWEEGGTPTSRVDRPPSLGADNISKC
jgi:hypothetical protein